MIVPCFKPFYVLGESIRLSFVRKGGDVRVYLVLSYKGETREVDFMKEGSQWVLNADSLGIGVNAWNYSIWREDGRGRVVIGRGTLNVLDEDTETVHPLERARKNVEMLKDARMGIYGNGIKKNKVRDREVDRFSPEELLKELAFWERELECLELRHGLRKRKNMQFYC